jgi:hypothetical protein
VVLLGLLAGFAVAIAFLPGMRKRGLGLRPLQRRTSTSGRSSR